MYRRSTLFLAASTSAFQMAALGRASKVRRLASFHDFEEHLLAPSADEQGGLVSMASYKGAHPVSFRVVGRRIARPRRGAVASVRDDAGRKIPLFRAARAPHRRRSLGQVVLVENVASI